MNIIRETKLKNGLILLDKPAGITSFKALANIKERLQLSRTGHAGTLDKFANGLLIVLTGQYTRLISLFTELDKLYETIFYFGKQTDTLDPEGNTIKHSDVPNLETIMRKISQFIGDLEQKPPVYSAVHVNGNRASTLARRGIKFNLKIRKVKIYSIDIISYVPPLLKLRIHCSKGVYIRSIARDLGTACHSCAYVNQLKRLKIGNFSISKAVHPEDFNIGRDIYKIEDMFSLLKNIHALEIKEEYEHLLLNGVSIKGDWFEKKPGDDGKYAIFSMKGTLLAVIMFNRNRFEYITVFNNV